MKRFLVLFMLSVLQLTLFANSQLDAIIQGQVLNTKSKYVILHYRNSPLDDTLQALRIELDDKGFFYQELPIKRPLEARIFNHEIYLEPEDRVEFTFDQLTSKINVNEKYQHNIYLQEFEQKFKNESASRIIAIKSLDPETYLKFEDSLKKVKEEFLYSSNLKYKLSDAFKARQLASYKYSCINHKYNYPNNYKYYTNNSASINESYYDFMIQNKFTEEDLVNVQDVFEYVNNFYRYKLNLDNNPVTTERDLIEREFTIAESLYLGRVKNILLTKVFAEILNSYSFELTKKYISRYMSNVKTDEYRKYIDSRISLASIASNNTIAYNFKLVDANGKMVQLSDFKGKKVYLNFWASWCVPCLEEIENHNLIQTKLGGTGFTTIMISVDEDKNAWKRVLKKYNKDIIQLNMPGVKTDVGKNYKLKSIPKSLLINADGVIIQDELPQPSNSQIIELLNSN